MVVVGASLSGLRAAETLRAEGFAGSLVLIGAERHFPPYDRPPLSKQVLAGAWEPEKARLRVDEGLSAGLLPGRRATGVDLERREVELDGGERMGFDGLVITTGAAPRSLPGTGDVKGVHLLRTIDDCLALRLELELSPRVAVIGGGFIGCEVAATCRQRGLEVTLIEALPLPLIRALGPEMGEVCAGLHRDHGVELRLGAGVDGLEGDTRVEAVRLADGTRVAADVVVVGIGVSPVTDWLEGSGLVLDDGVVCDAACAAVGGERVVAAGDVARWPNERFGEVMRVEHWTNAAEQGEHAAKTLLHGPEKAGPFAPIPYFWSDQYSTKFQFLGIAGDEVEVVEGDVGERRFVAAYGRRGRLVGALCVSRPNRTIPWRRLIDEGAPFPPDPPA